jgi:hypothetical protein
MAFRLSASTGELHRPLPADDLRRAFESAVGDLREADRALKKRLHRTPIVQRPGILGISRETVEKRALTDAARALAQLWKV